MRWSIHRLGLDGLDRAIAINSLRDHTLVTVTPGAYADKLGVRVTADLEQVSEGADVVALCDLPCSERAGLARRFLDDDCHVVIDGMPQSLGELDQLLQYGAERDLVVHIGSLMRYESGSRMLLGGVGAGHCKAVVLHVDRDHPVRSRRHLLEQLFDGLVFLFELAGPVSEVLSTEFSDETATLTLQLRDCEAHVRVQSGGYFPNRTEVLAADDLGTTWRLLDGSLFLDDAQTTLIESAPPAEADVLDFKRRFDEKLPQDLGNIRAAMALIDELASENC